MRLSVESSWRRRACLVACWGAVIAALAAHNLAVGRYLTLSGEMGRRGLEASSTPLRHPIPAFASDAQTWIRHALSLAEGERLRLRYTDIDNAVEGREVHWSSAWAWAIAAAGMIWRACVGDPLPLAVERASLWLNFAVLSLVIILFSGWVSRRAGAIGGVVVAVGMAGSDRFYEGFYPAYVDHHGLLSAAALGVMLGAVFMGAGWWQADGDEALMLPRSPRAVRSAAIFSAICGGCGMGVSAASIVPALVIVGVSALASSTLAGPRMQAAGANFDADAWRLWGRVGGAMSGVFYLMEYVPQFVGMRLEVNHPLYALAWVCGGEVVATASAWRMLPRDNRRNDAVRLACALAGVLALPVAIRIGGPNVFALNDPFMVGLHERIGEFQSPLAGGVGPAIHTMQSMVDPVWAAVVAGIGLVWLRREKGDVVLWFTILATLLFTALGLWQKRWLMAASGAQICMLLVVLAVGLAGRSAALRWGVALTACGLTMVPPILERITATASRVEAGAVAPQDALQPLFRDIAAALRASQPTGEIVLLASPLGSTAVGYYGRFKTIGTLYWENAAGLKAAGRIFSAPASAEAAALIKAHGITHIAMISEQNFIGSYFELLHPDAPPESVRDCFGYRLLVKGRIPSWLRMLPYRPPADLDRLDVDVCLYQVDFSQTPAEAAYHLGLAQLAGDDPAAAVETWATGLSRAPQAERRRLSALAGRALEERGLHPLADRMRRLSVAEEQNQQTDGERAPKP